MGKSFAQSKGQRSERAVIKMLQPIVDKVYMEGGIPNDTPSLERNLMQSNKGGYDIVGLEWLALEVKHQETLQVAQWWEQARRQAGDSGKVPVLIYKKNNVKWRVVMFAKLAPPCSEWAEVDISVDSFLVYFEARVRHQVATSKFIEAVA